MCNPILDILLKTQPHCSQSGCEIMRPHPAAHPHEPISGKYLPGDHTLPLSQCLLWEEG